MKLKTLDYEISYVIDKNIRVIKKHWQQMVFFMNGKIVAKSDFSSLSVCTFFIYGQWSATSDRSYAISIVKNKSINK